MLGINMNDVITTLNLLKPQLIIIGVCLVLAILVTIFAVKIKKPARGLTRGTAWVAFILVLALVVNQILTGPMYSMVSMVFKKGGDISEQSITDASFARSPALANSPAWPEMPPIQYQAFSSCTSPCSV